MSKPRHIVFFTGKRGGFNHFVPIFRRMDQEKTLRYSIIASDMHLSPAFGHTVDEVRQWSENLHTVETLFASDSKAARAKSVGVGLMGIADLLPGLDADMAFILGDRTEVMAMAIAAMTLNIPIAHIHGGDVTKGGTDEVVRHALTKMANIHFASNEASAERIRRMGEESWRVHNVGSPVLDLIREKRFTPPGEAAKKFGLDPDKPVLVLLQHSVTWQVDEAGFQARQTMEAIDSLGYQTVAVYPCSDPGYAAVLDVLREYESRPYFQLHKNIEFQDFWGLLALASAFVGNSSAGVLETPSFGLPFVNIGMRQEGRLRADNVLDVDHDKGHIAQAIETAVHDSSFRARVAACVSPYGDGHASERIVDVLKNVALDGKLLQKRLTYDE